MFGAHFHSPDGKSLVPYKSWQWHQSHYITAVFTGLTRAALKTGFCPPSRPSLVSTSPTREMTRWSPFCHTLKPTQQLLLHAGCIFSPFGLWPLCLHLWNAAQLSPLLGCAPWLPPPKGLSPVQLRSAPRTYSHPAPIKRSDSYPFTCPSLSGLWALWGKGMALWLWSPSAGHSTRHTLTCRCSKHVATEVLPHCILLFPFQSYWLTQADMFYGPKASVQQYDRFSQLLRICLRGCALKEVARTIIEN